jgi:hypothetical protein
MRIKRMRGRMEDEVSKVSERMEGKGKRDEREGKEKKRRKEEEEKRR